MQILACLNLLAKHKIIHCDLKPCVSFLLLLKCTMGRMTIMCVRVFSENVLLKAPNKSGIKVIDFGSSCAESERLYTYVQSRFYRAPEVIVGAPYSCPIDMWSLAAILVELYTGYPIFPGENEQDQLWCMLEVLGLPDKDLMARAERKSMFFGMKVVPLVCA